VIKLNNNEANLKQLGVFFQQCFRSERPVADFNLIKDSQTDRILNKIFDLHKTPLILDYGCGNLRLANALVTYHPQKKWKYLGVDRINPKISHPDLFNQMASKNIKTCDQINSSDLLSFRSMHSKYNIAVLMNILHELSIQDISESIEDIRRHLSEDGYLLLLDLPILLEGEQTFVPLNLLDVGFLFGDFKNYSYETRTGINILFAIIHKSNIPIFHNLSIRLHSYFKIKRGMLSQIANFISKGENYKIPPMMSLGKNVLLNYGYANTVVTNINNRILEFEKSKYVVDMEEISKCTLELVELFDEFYYKKDILPKLRNVYDSLSNTHDYKTIEYVINTFQNYEIIFRVYDHDRPLQPTEVWDLLDYKIGWDKVKDIGLEETLRKAYRMHVDRYNKFYD